MKQKTFYEEIGQIQSRHSIFFPDSQMQFIKVKKSGDSYNLKYLDGYALPDVITMEIELAFKLIFK